MPPKTFLPSKGTKEWNEEVEFYTRSTSSDRTRRAEELGFNGPGSYRSAMCQKGIHVSSDVSVKPPTHIPPPEPPEPVVIPAVKLKIKPLPQEGKRKEGEEEMIVQISDAHVGLLTPTYDTKVFIKRLGVLQDFVFRICQMHRKMRPIRKLHILYVGDIVQGQQIGTQGRAEEFEIPDAEHQIYDYAIPAFTNFSVNMLQMFDTIEEEVVEGNHGNIQKRSQTITKRANWDTIFGRALKESLSKYDRISVDVETETWWKIVDINGWKFLLVHLDQIQSYNQVPFYGIQTRAQRWKQSLPDFDYILGGHFHNPNFLWNNEIPTYVNGCMISDSDFPLTRMGMRDVPQQWVLFVNKKHGVTANYRVRLDPPTQAAESEQ